MAEKTIKVCDICGVAKGENNHWWKMWVEESVLGTMTSENLDIEKHLKSQDIRIYDVCGQAHAVDLFNRFLQNGSLEDSV